MPWTLEAPHWNNVNEKVLELELLRSIGVPFLEAIRKSSSQESERFTHFITHSRKVTAAEDFCGYSR